MTTSNLTTGERSRWLDMLDLYESMNATYCPSYDYLIQYGLERGWIDPETGGVER